MTDNRGTAQTVVPHEGTLDCTRFKAALFDLGGVVTQTAAVHARAWKRLFDDDLRANSIRTGRPFRSFDLEDDYRRYVDGKPRYEGVKSFLDSRGIALPWGQA